VLIIQKLKNIGKYMLFTRLVTLFNNLATQEPIKSNTTAMQFVNRGKAILRQEEELDSNLNAIRDEIVGLAEWAQNNNNHTLHQTLQCWVDELQAHDLLSAITNVTPGALSTSFINSRTRRPSDTSFSSISIEPPTPRTSLALSKKPFVELNLFNKQLDADDAESAKNESSFTRFLKKLNCCR
jgi:hypothetical protein